MAESGSLPPDPITGEAYQPPTYTSVPDGWLRPYVCSKCGAVVHERLREMHSQWHAELVAMQIATTKAIRETASLVGQTAHTHGPGK